MHCNRGEALATLFVNVNRPNSTPGIECLETTTEVAKPPCRSMKEKRLSLMVWSYGDAFEWYTHQPIVEMFTRSIIPLHVCSRDGMRLQH
jgi:hypothetical protein